ncbi:hypothetical protein [uncultured Nonlabens sp.]|uniref:hypothetical protein n=1 Tax=uncultured Nonlabens sp. TaxID=859306 RepID=UPI0026315E52|nr:hypothetical protein [uncultured Nonlabens sp.]
MIFRLLLSKWWLLVLPVVAFSNTINNRNGAFCGWDPAWEDNYYPIVDQFSLVSPDFHAFLNCPNSPFCDTSVGKQPSQNIAEWTDYFKGVFTEEELIDIIYKRPVGWFLDQEGFDSYNDEIGNKINKSENLFFKKYLALAKISQHTSSDISSSSGWYQGERDYYGGDAGQIDKRELLSKALELVANAPDDFMRNRAGFQAVKMAHYLQESEMAMRYFNTILKKSTTGNYIYYRAMEEMAGAAFNNNDQVLAAVSYLEVYDQLPDRRYTAAVSLRFLNWDLLENSYEFKRLNKNNDVKGFFKAFHGRGNVLREMENISRDNVNSPYLDVLAVRWLDQMQSEVFEHTSNYYDDGDDSVDSGAVALGFFTEDLLKNKNLKNRDLWTLIKATTQLYNQENNKALATLENHKAAVGFKKHFKRLKTAITFMAIKSLDRQAINRSYETIARDIDLHTHKPTVAAFFNHISALYNEADNPIVSVLTSINYDSYSNDKEYNWAGVGKTHGYSWEYDSKYHYLREDYINNFDLFISSSQPTAFEKTILKRMKAVPKDYVHDLRGTYFMRKDLLENALLEFKQIKTPEVFWENGLRTELFSASIKEYMNIPFTSMSNGFHENYSAVLGENVVIEREDIERENYKDNKIKLVQNLIKLNQLAQTETNKTADYYYMIGNAWYNMSHQGWFMNNTYYIGNNNRNELAGSDYGDDDDDDGEKDDSFIIYQANDYLLKGLRVEDGSRETKAAILFMLAKTNSCEDGRYDYNTNTYTFNICGEHKDYFNQLNNEYSDTEYYREVLEECSWFKNYVN